ncbi:MAG: T9SS type A sorting domain-containing protein [Bacteroidota bacterium]
MKNLKFLLPIIALSIYSFHIQAQDIQIQFLVTNASAPGVCDGVMDIQCIGCPSSVTYTWYDTTVYLPQVIGTGNHITGLCITSQRGYIVAISDGTCGSMIYAGIKDASVSGTTFQLNTSLFYYNDTAFGHLTIDQVSGGTSPYWYSVYNQHDHSQFGKVAVDTNLAQINNIAIDDSLLAWYGYYDLTLRVGDYMNNFIGYNFTTFYDTVTCSAGPNPLWLSAQGYPVSDSSLCDGRGYAIAYGGKPPYIYNFSSGSTDSTVSGLCPGYYIVTVTDSLSNTVNTTFVVGKPGTIYFTDPYSLTYLDTLYSNAAQNCGLDYSIPVDTCYWDTSYVLSTWEYVIKWVIVQDTNKYKFTQVYHIDSSGNYMFGLSVYCNQRSSDFGSFSFFIGLHVNMPIVMDISVLKEETNSILYPNPSNGIYRLTAASLLKQYKIYDQLGRKVVEKTVHSKDEIINITEVKSGMYYLHIQYENGLIHKQKLLKN